MAPDAVSRRRPGRGRRRGHAAGLSLVEMMIASLILLIVLLGILPMFIHSMQNNAAGREMSQAANQGRGDAEWMMQQPLDADDFELQPGQLTRQNTWRWVVDPADPVAGGRWVATTGPGVVAVATGRQNWERTRNVRLFNVSSILPPGAPGPTGPLDGGTPAEFVHLHESVTESISLREAGNPLFGPLTADRARSVEITVARAF